MCALSTEWFNTKTYFFTNDLDLEILKMVNKYYERFKNELDN